MKFWAKVNLENKEREMAAFLLMRFFEEFNPESSICFKGQEAIMDIVFDEPPQGIIKALSYFSDGKLEFYYGKNPEEYENGPSFEPQKVSKETETTGQSAHEAAELPTQDAANNSAENVLGSSESAEVGEAQAICESAQNAEPRTTCESTENAEAQALIQPTGKKHKEGSKVHTNSETKEPQKVRRPCGLGKTEQPDLSEFAKKATSYEAFCENIADWLEMKEKQIFFIQLILAAGEVKEIAWKNIDAILDARGIHHKSYHRIWIGQRINEKFKEIGKYVTTLPLLQEIVSYQNFDFQNQSEGSLAKVNLEEVSAETFPKEISEEVEVISEDASNNSSVDSEDTVEQQISIPNTRVRMKCMLGENPELEEALATIDKTQPIDERVKRVLRTMGWVDDEANIEHDQIFRMINVGIRTRKISFEQIYSKAGIPADEQAEARMTFSKFINDALIKGPYVGFKVHTSEFLRELQSIIMVENEFEDVNV